MQTLHQTLGKAAALAAVSFCMACAVAQQAAPAASGARPAARPPLKAASQPSAESGPTWTELGRDQQRALAPLASAWKTLPEGQKRKWLVLSRNYPTLSEQDQKLLHSRMSEWIALSPQQRTQARLNFAETKKLQAPDKKAAWEAYQALPPEERTKLAAGAKAVKPPPPPTAPALKPAPPQKLTRMPQGKQPNTPGIAVAPDQVDHNTLLPQPGVGGSARN